MEAGAAEVGAEDAAGADREDDAGEPPDDGAGAGAEQPATSSAIAPNSAGRDLETVARGERRMRRAYVAAASRSAGRSSRVGEGQSRPASDDSPVVPLES